MKTATQNKTIDCYLPVYNSKGEGTCYLIRKLYDLNLKQCLAEIEDIEVNAVHEVRLLTKWFVDYNTLEPVTYKGEFGEGIKLPIPVIQMIDINFFENFY